MKNKGFTLIELLVVVVIIGILSIIAIPQFSGQLEQARDSDRKAAIKIINSIIQTNYISSNSTDYSVTNKSDLASELNKQGYPIPSGIDDGLCYVYGYKDTTFDEFFIAIGLEGTGGGTMSVAGTTEGVDTANTITVTIAANTTGNCTDNANKIAALEGQENTYNYVIF